MNSVKFKTTVTFLFPMPRVEKPAGKPSPIGVPWGDAVALGMDLASTKRGPQHRFVFVGVRVTVSNAWEFLVSITKVTPPHLRTAPSTRPPSS